MATGFSVSLILVLLIKLFFIVFVVALVGGLVFAAKNYIFTPEDIAALKGTFTSKNQTEEIK